MWGGGGGSQGEYVCVHSYFVIQFTWGEGGGVTENEIHSF